MFELTKKQQEIVDSNARIKLIMGGMRSGKTTVLLGCLGKEMRALNSPYTKVLIYETDPRQSRFMFNEIGSYFGSKNIFSYNATTHTIKTTKYGTIEIELLNDLEYMDTGYDIVVVDCASRNRYVKEIIDCHSNSCNVNGLTKLIVAGHCPKDKENAFYKVWINAYYCNMPDAKAFRLSTWDNPAMWDKKEEHETKLIQSMGLDRYIRDYYATFNE